MKKLISLGSSVPLLLGSMLCLANSANAAIITGSALNFVGGLQLNAAGNTTPVLGGQGIPIVTPILPTGEHNGGANGYQDFLWIQTLPALNDSPTIISTNRVINSTPGGSSGPGPGVVDAQIITGVGGAGQTTAFPTGSGSFSGIPSLTNGALLNLDLSPLNATRYDCQEADFSDCFLVIGGFAFGINTQNITTTAGGGIGSSSATVFLPEATVRRTSNPLDTASARLDLTFNGLFDDGVTAGDPTAGDFVTSAGSYSATFTVVQNVTVPEPSSVVALAVTALGGGLLARRKSRK